MPHPAQFRPLRTREAGLAVLLVARCGHRSLLAAGHGIRSLSCADLLGLSTEIPRSCLSILGPECPE